MCSARRFATFFAGREREKDTSELFPFSKSVFTDDYRSAAKKTDCALVSHGRHEIGRRGAPVTNARLSVEEVARPPVFGNNEETRCAAASHGKGDDGLEGL